MTLPTPHIRRATPALLQTLLVTTLGIASGLMHNAAHAQCETVDPDTSDFPDSVVSSTENGGIQSAWYDMATSRYAHGVLGDAIEPSSLQTIDDKGCTRSVVLDEDHVFEDLAPRLADIDGIAGLEAITIRSHQNYGAQLAIYQLVNSKVKLLATTPYIGTSNRWLAPVGIADFNNDGDMDIAFVDRPHLAKTLRVWTYKNGNLEQIASKAGYSNHRIGEDFISGGTRNCNGITTMITADASWNRILETTLQGDQLVSVDVADFNGPASMDSALACN